MANLPYKLKIISIGPVDAGRSDILPRFADSYFKARYTLSVGVDIFTKIIKDICCLSIWDISSANRYTFIRKTFYKGASGALLFFNRANKQSWYILKDWYNEVFEVLGSFPFILLGTYKEYDNYPPPDVKQEDFREFAKTKNGIYVEISAEGNLDLNSSLQWLVGQILSRFNISKS